MPTDDQIAKLEEQLIAQAPDGLSEQEFNSWLSERMNEALSADRTWKDTAVDALPMVGGAVGGTVGGIGGAAFGLGVGGAPGAIGGATLGGAAGESVRRLVQLARGKRKPGASTMGEDAAGIATEGAIQGASEAVGGAVGKGLQKGGRAIYRGLLKPSKAIREGFGGDAVVRTLMDEGVTISGKGLDKITGKLGASRDAALKMVQDAAPTSTYVKPSEIISEFGDAVKTLRNRVNVGQPSELAKVGERGKRLIKALTTGAGMDAAGAQVAKETAQDAASGAYRMMERGGAKQLGADDLLDEATARGFRKAVEKRVPGVAAQNQRTQALLGAKRALDDAVEGRANNMAVGGARDIIAAGTGAAVGGPAGLATGLASRVLASPRAGSAAAIGLNRVGKKVPIDELIRALDALIRESGRE